MSEIETTSVTIAAAVAAAISPIDDVDQQPLAAQLSAFEATQQNLRELLNKGLDGQSA